ncbi:MAG: response regulator [Cytophagales bacterium]|nr:response regulator [Rhizobacter sp.]
MQRSTGAKVKNLFGGKASSLDNAARELAELQEQSSQVRVVLAHMQEQLLRKDGPQVVGSQATQLVEANEQLVLSAIRAQTDAEALTKALDQVSQAAELNALIDRRARESLAGLNATLEGRVVARTQELEQARDEALSAGRAKEQFLSNMSHEIRTPMYGMLGALELLSGTQLTEQQRQYISVASTSGEALLGVINEVLDFAKIGAGQFELNQEAIDVLAVVRSVTLLFSSTAKSKLVELRLESSPFLTGWRLGDALRIRQVLINLVGNAMKFTQSGMVVVRVHGKGDEQGERVAFEVTDTGPGIAESQLEKIFEPFVQAEHTTERVLGGTGLGLAISRGLVRAMGGELEVTSKLGIGTTFCFELNLPRVHGATAAVPLSLPPAERLRLSGRALLVEDNSVNRLIGTAMLERLGLEVVVAEDGKEALDRLAADAFEVVLMDCQMPVMDGYQATTRLREIERMGGKRRTPVIALTANAFSGDVEQCLAAGMDAHLAKPFAIEQLHAIIVPWMPASAKR